MATPETHAGPSTDTQLVIRDLCVSGELPGPGQGGKERVPILALPNEILSDIIELAVSVHYGRDPSPFQAVYCCADVAEVARVCRRFHCIVLPFLYHSFISSTTYSIPPRRLARCFYHSIKDNPSLGHFVRRLGIKVDRAAGVTEADFFAARLFAQRMPNVRALVISGNFRGECKDKFWDIVRLCQQHMRSLEWLRIYGPGICPVQFMDSVDVPSLRRLEVGSASTRPGETCSFNAEVDASSFPPRAHGLAASESVGPWFRRSFVELQSICTGLHVQAETRKRCSQQSLSQYRGSLDALEHLTKWPRALRIFLLHEAGEMSQLEHGITLPMLQPMLKGHRETLRFIDIMLLQGPLASTGNGMEIDLSEFPALETLALSRWQMSKGLESPEEDARLLLAPNLREFRWTFFQPIWGRPKWADFGSKEQHWLRAFAHAAVARGAKLRVIDVQYDPVEESGPRNPWKRLRKVRREFKPLGLRVTFPKTRG